MADAPDEKWIVPPFKDEPRGSKDSSTGSSCALPYPYQIFLVQGNEARGRARAGDARVSALETIENLLRNRESRSALDPWAPLSTTGIHSSGIHEKQPCPRTGRGKKEGHCVKLEPFLW